MYHVMAFRRLATLPDGTAASPAAFAQLIKTDKTLMENVKATDPEVSQDVFNN